MGYTPEQWDALIKDMAKLGLKYIVMCNVMIGGVCIYDSALAPKITMGCDDPMEEVFKAADKYGMKIFMTNDYYEKFEFEDVLCKESMDGRRTIVEEIVKRYGHHKSFYGWYWAWEAYIGPYFSDHFMKYINSSTAMAREYTPDAKFLTAPYGTSNAVCDDKFLSQLEKLDVDIVAYQDTVGCYATDIDGSRRAFEILRRAHDKVPQRALWADVETFTWEGEANRKETPLIPAQFSRLEGQLEAVSPFVDEILVFIFEGLFSDPNSIAFTGYPEAARYYNEYTAWMKKNHPECIKEL